MLKLDFIRRKKNIYSITNLNKTYLLYLNKDLIKLHYLNTLLRYNKTLNGKGHEKHYVNIMKQPHIRKPDGIRC